MTITTYEWRLIAPICFICAIVCLVVGIHFVRVNKTRAAVKCAVGAFVMAAVLVVVTFVYSNSRQVSNCTVTVCDSSGLITEKYSGKLTVTDEEKGYVVFEDENGNEHTVANVDGAIIIEQQFESDQLSGQDYSVITVKTSNGLIIEQYSGYYDVKENKVGYISFEDINGKALTISYSGTVTIDVE